MMPWADRARWTALSSFSAGSRKHLFRRASVHVNPPSATRDSSRVRWRTPPPSRPSLETRNAFFGLSRPGPHPRSTGIMRL